MNPKTAEAYGLKNDDWVEVESIHGRARFVVELFEGLAPDVLMARRGWWQSCQPLGLSGYDCLDGGSDPNVLYDSTMENFDNFHSGMSKQTLVRMKKIDNPFPEDGVCKYPQPTVYAEKPAVPSVVAKEDAPCYKIAFNPDLCIKCYACELTCKAWHDQPSALPGRRTIIELAEGSYINAKRTFLSVSCQQCAEPACMAACPAGAISKDANGTIVVDKKRCVRCGMCLSSCPVGAPHVTPLGMDKCDMCSSCGVAPGTDPHCVATCPTKALTLTADMKEFKANVKTLVSSYKEFIRRDNRSAQGVSHD